jgi:hypothetical protein
MSSLETKAGSGANRRYEPRRTNYPFCANSISSALSYRARRRTRSSLFLAERLRHPERPVRGAPCLADEYAMNADYAEVSFKSARLAHKASRSSKSFSLSEFCQARYSKSQCDRRKLFDMKTARRSLIGDPVPLHGAVGRKFDSALTTQPVISG